MSLLDRARHFIALESEAVAGLQSVIGPAFAQAVELMRGCRGRVVVTGMGKAGLVGQKIAATLASTGTPAFFVHPAEAIHGDLGMITADDVAVALSNSGQTEEVLRILPPLKHLHVPIISVTSNGRSDLAKHSDVALVMEIAREACPMNLAPTSSTTAMMALGDTLALVLLEARGFTAENYALLHPGGSLGRRLLIKVSDLMHAGEDNPVVSEDTPLANAIYVMTSRKLASTSVVGADGRLVGFFSDGDLRRYLLQGTPDMQIAIGNLMTRNPKTARPEMMAVKAYEVLSQYKILELPVVDDAGVPIGMIHLHDITRAGIA